MAENWITFLDKTYSGSDNYYSLRVQFQYDTNATTVTTLTCRTKSWLTTAGYKYHTSDTYFLYSKDGAISRICYLGSTNTTGPDGTKGEYPYYSNTFTITKDKYATSFSIPEMAICNDGSYRAISNYTDSNGRGYAEYFTGVRKSWRTIINSGGSTKDTSVYVIDGTSPEIITFRDAGDNKVHITGKLGEAVLYNPMTVSNLYCTTNGNMPGLAGTTKESLTAKSAGTFSEYISIPESNADAKTGAAVVKAIVYCGFAHSDDTHSGNKSVNATFYKAPGQPGKPALTADSYNSGDRLTTRKTWTYSWTAAAAGNTGSPIAGYRIRVYKNDETVPIRDANGNAISDSNDDGVYWWDSESSSTKFSINPAHYEFAAGDTVQLYVDGYAKNGKGTKLFNTLPAGWSAETTVEKAGIVDVKVSNSWKEGQVWVKVNGSWKEAEAIQSKAGGTWHEAQ
jgi:hypothetical protein